MFARRKFSAVKNLIEFMGLEPGRLQFSWISSAEAEKFATTATTVIESVRELGPAHFMQKQPLVKVA